MDDAASAEQHVEDNVVTVEENAATAVGENVATVENNCVTVGENVTRLHALAAAVGFKLDDGSAAAADGAKVVGDEQDMSVEAAHAREAQEAGHHLTVARHSANWFWFWHTR
jgi:hypothetical protein